MSSSSSSQCSPRLLMDTWSRCSAEPCSKRGNQASGTPRVRPSESSTHMLSWSKRTALALTEELIPYPADWEDVQTQYALPKATRRSALQSECHSCTH